jgi:hypothetical protein
MRYVGRFAGAPPVADWMRGRLGESIVLDGTWKTVASSSDDMIIHGPTYGSWKYARRR